MRAFDPVATAEARKIFSSRIVFTEGAYEAVRGADALAILTEWNEFRTPDFTRIKECLKRPLIFDGRNLYDPKVLEGLGFRYFSMGRPGTR